MQYLIAFAVLSLAAAAPKPGLLGGYADDGIGGLSGWGAPAYSSVSLAQPVVHAAPVVHAPVAIAKPAATSYSSFQQVVHPVSIAQPVVHAAPVLSQPLVHAPVVQTVSQPLLQSYHSPVVQTVSQPLLQSYHAPVISQPVVQKYLSVGSYGHGW